MPGWGIAFDGREVSIVQRRRLLEMVVFWWSDHGISVEYGIVEPVGD